MRCYWFSLVQDGVSDVWEVGATIKVHGHAASDSDGFGGSPFPLSPHWPHHSRIPLVNTVFILGHMHCDTVFDVTSHHSTLVFHQSDLQCSFGLADVYTPSQSLHGLGMQCRSSFSSGTCNFTLISTCTCLKVFVLPCLPEPITAPLLFLLALM